MADPRTLKQGSIIWKWAADQRGHNPKLRAFVVVTPTAEIKPGTNIVCVAVTGTFREPPDEFLIPMRWNAAGTTETGFTKKCYAKCDWLHKVQLRAGTTGLEFDGTFEGKRLRVAELQKILNRLEQMRKDAQKH